MQTGSPKKGQLHVGMCLDIQKCFLSDSTLLSGFIFLLLSPERRYLFCFPLKFFPFFVRASCLSYSASWAACERQCKCARLIAFEVDTLWITFDTAEVVLKQVLKTRYSKSGVKTLILWTLLLMMTHCLSLQSYITTPPRWQSYITAFSRYLQSYITKYSRLQ